MVERAGERIKKNGITFTNHQAASCVCLPAGDRDRPIFEEVLLVDQDEEDVIAKGSVSPMWPRMNLSRGSQSKTPANIRRRKCVDVNAGAGNRQDCQGYPAGVHSGKPRLAEVRHLGDELFVRLR